METWTWLEREGLIALTPDTDADAVFVTRSLSRYEKWSGGKHPYCPRGGGGMQEAGIRWRRSKDCE
jgi:hypothetical protein